jgi:hypothetical protein
LAIVKLLIRSDIYRGHLFQGALFLHRELVECDLAIGALRPLDGGKFGFRIGALKHDWLEHIMQAPRLLTTGRAEYEGTLSVSKTWALEQAVVLGSAVLIGQRWEGTHKRRFKT